MLFVVIVLVSSSFVIGCRLNIGFLIVWVVFGSVVMKLILVVCMIFMFVCICVVNLSVVLCL